MGEGTGVNRFGMIIFFLGSTCFSGYEGSKHGCKRLSGLNISVQFVKVFLRFKVN